MHLITDSTCSLLLTSQDEVKNLFQFFSGYSEKTESVIHILMVTGEFRVAIFVRRNPTDRSISPVQPFLSNITFNTEDRR